MRGGSTKNLRSMSNALVDQIDGESQHANKKNCTFSPEHNNWQILDKKIFKNHWSSWQLFGLKNSFLKIEALLWITTEKFNSAEKSSFHKQNELLNHNSL